MRVGLVIPADVPLATAGEVAATNSWTIAWLPPPIERYPLALGLWQARQAGARHAIGDHFCVAEDRRAMADRVRAALSGRLRLSGPDHIAMLQRRADAGENLSPGQRGFLAAIRRASGPISVGWWVATMAVALARSASPWRPE